MFQGLLFDDEARTQELARQQALEKAQADALTGRLHGTRQRNRSPTAQI